MPKEKRRPQAYRTLAWRIAVLTLALWIACMGLLTWCVASDMLTQIEEQLETYVRHSADPEPTNEAALPGTFEHSMIDRLGHLYHFIDLDTLLPLVHEQRLTNRVSSDNWIGERWDLYYGYEAAVIYYNEDNEIFIQTGDYLTFAYTTKEHWTSQNTKVIGKGYVALDEIPGGAEAFHTWFSNRPVHSVDIRLFLPLLRLTGYFEGNEFHPAVIDRGEAMTGVATQEAGRFDLSVWDSENQIKWETILSVPADEGVVLETIYAWDVGGISDSQKKVTVKGETFESLADLLHHDLTCGVPYSYRQGSLCEAVLISRQTNEDAAVTLAAAVHCKPLQYAFLRLPAVYIVSLAIVLVCLWLILRTLKRRLTAPIERMVRAAGEGTAIIPSARCAELYDLESYFSETHQALSENKAELQQLRTALAYAHDAEEKRKQLISNITHELKTPLAIIHSYAEYLQEDVSGVPQEQQLKTILEETERMDAMVVQMLDLSRLDAGRIRLASDPVSLLALTKSIAERMKPLFEARDLTLHYDFVQDFTIAADEARMEQVITNLLSNAQKYTAQGGSIRIRIYLEQGSAYFYIGNTAEHLSDEALQKVWDSFYRVDTSRSTAGVGLGLSLVKSIISLHGGNCSVRNTSLDGQGVEFGFVLPLK